MRAKEPKDLRALDAIEQATANGSNLTRQLLSFARRQRLNRVSVDLRERLGLFRDLLVSSVGGAVNLQVEVDPVTWRVEVDVGELELALVNIAVNARDAMPGGGTLKITSNNVHFDGTGTVALSGDFVALSLADTGCGMSAGTLSKVFEPFFTTKEIGKGTGLGLSQVFGFTHQSGGNVQIMSKEGAGTTITLFLPRSTSATQAAKQEIRIRPSASENGTILVVEDNLAVGEVSSMLLEQFGYRVKHVTRAADALDLLERDSDVDLVFSDILMPGNMDGLGLAKAIRKRFPDLPVLLATGRARRQRVPHYPQTLRPRRTGLCGQGRIGRGRRAQHPLSLGRIRHFPPHIPVIASSACFWHMSATLEAVGPFRPAMGPKRQIWRLSMPPGSVSKYRKRDQIHELGA
jgi:CheY-like chemotaxis protein